MNITRPSPLLRKFVLYVGLLLAGSLFFLPLPSAAQSSAGNPLTLIEHLQGHLQSNSYERRESALVDVIALTTCRSSCAVSLRSVNKKNKQKMISFANETGTGRVMDLNALIPDLQEIYRSGPADGLRLLALSALINIGDAKALEQLIEEGARQSEGVNRATQRSLAAFYLEKYPELRNRTLRNGQLSLDDVRRAETIRVKRAKKAAKNKG